MFVASVLGLSHKALTEGKLKLIKKQNLTVTYHDPCLLGRLSEKYVPWNGEIQAYGVHVPPKPWRRGTNGVYEAPREILKSIPGVKLVEMPRNAENSFCCGGGGGVPAVFPEFTKWAVMERLDEAAGTGATAVVSACPFCQENFKKTSNEVLKYFDITELVAKSL